MQQICGNFSGTEFIINIKSINIEYIRELLVLDFPQENLEDSTNIDNVKRETPIKKARESRDSINTPNSKKETPTPENVQSIRSSSRNKRKKIFEHILLNAILL
jgi:hypothetical protein